MIPRRLRWYLEIDDRDEAVLIAASRYHDDGSPFEHRIRQIANGKLSICFCDAEIGGERGTKYDSLQEAMEACEKDERR